MFVRHSATGLLLAVMVAGALAQDEIDLFSRVPFTPGARAAGMAGAFSAVADDYTAMYYNPAGLAGMKRLELSGSGYLGLLNNESDMGSGTTATTNDSYAGVSHCGLVLPLPAYRGGLAFALGYQHLLDFTQPYGVNDADTTILVTEEGGIDAWTLGFGLQMSRRFWGGVALELLTGTEKYLFTAEAPAYQDREFQHLDLTGLRITLGGMLHVTRKLQLALVLRTPLWYNFTWTEYQYQLVVDGVVVDEYNDLYADYKLYIPFELTGGAAWRSRWLTLSGDFIFSDWSQVQYEIDNPDPATELDIRMLNREIERDYQPRVGMRLGAEYTIPTTDLMLRGGLAHYPLAGPRTELTPRTQVTGGIGYLVDQVMDLNLAVGYQLADFEYTYDGTTIHENRTAWSIRFGFYYRFQP